MALTWDTVVAYALSLKDTESGTYYNKPTVKANGRALISPGPEPGSFVLHIDLGTKLLLMEIDPDTYWQTSHYDGWPALLVRYDSDHPEQILSMIEKSYDQAMNRKPPRARKKRRTP